MNRFGLGKGMVWAGGLLGIFVVPWLVPVVPVPSLSYAYGFNNQAARLALVAMLGLLFALDWIGRRRRGAAEDDGFGVPAPGPAHDSPGWRIGSAAALLFFAGLLGFWFYVILVPGTPFGEMSYFMRKLDLMRAGFHPYRDFEFTYGPGMLYPSYWLSRLSGGAVSVAVAYGAALVVHWVAGGLLLFYLARNLGGRWGRIRFFLPALLAMLNLCLGLNYTPLRFVCAFAALVFLHRSLPREGTRVPWQTAGAGFLLSLGCFLVSPEMGIAAGAAFVLYFGALAWIGRRGALAGLLASVLSFPAATLFFGRAYFPGALRIGAGVIDFPIFPTAQVLLLIGAACLVLPRLGVLGLERLGRREPAGAFTVASVVLLGLLLAPALGRCDSGHILFNGFGIFFLALIFVARFRERRFWRPALLAFLVFLPGLGLLGFWSLYQSSFRNGLEAWIPGKGPNYTDHSGESAAQKMAYGRALLGQVLPALGHPSRVAPYPGGYAAVPRDDFSGLPSSGRIGAPFDCAPDILRHLAATGQLVRRSPFDSDHLSDSQMERKLGEIGEMDFVLAPREFQLIPGRSFFGGELDAAGRMRPRTQFLSRLLLFPIPLREFRNPPVAPGQHFAAEIARRYVPVGTYRDGIVLARKPGP